MARDIKFRAWHNYKGEMFYWEDIQNWYFILIEDERFEFMQYTGLKDKNGIEIYEGDIMDYGHGRFFYISYVECCGFVATFNKSVINSMIPIHNFEIIGNIYQNPELISQKYSWFKNHEEELDCTVIHTENDVDTIIAITDSAEKADFISKACNQFSIEKYESADKQLTKMDRWRF